MIFPAQTNRRLLLYPPHLRLRICRFILFSARSTLYRPTSHSKHLFHLVEYVIQHLLRLRLRLRHLNVRAIGKLDGEEVRRIWRAW
jgi:hypothetical protein